MSKALDEQMRMLHAIAFARRYDEAVSWLVGHYFGQEVQPIIPAPAVADPQRCKVESRDGRQCVRRTGHTQRHRYKERS